MNSPKHISPSPLVNAVIEIRVSSQLKAEDIVSTFYPVLSHNFPKLIKYGDSISGNKSGAVLNLPKNFLYYPEFTFENEQYAISIGPRVVNFRSVTKYPGWEIFAEEFKAVMNSIAVQNWITKLDRIGIRFTNSFENRILARTLNLNKLEFNGFKEDISLYVGRLRKDKLEILIQIAELAKATVDNREITAPVLDTDVNVMEGLPEKINDDVFLLISQMHTEQRALFFQLLSKEYSDTLHLTY